MGLRINNNEGKLLQPGRKSEISLTIHNLSFPILKIYLAACTLVRSHCVFAHADLGQEKYKASTCPLQNQMKSTSSIPDPHTSTTSSKYQFVNMQFNTLLGLAFLAAAALAAPLVEVRQLCGTGGPYGGSCPPDVEKLV